MRNDWLLMTLTPSETDERIDPRVCCPTEERANDGNSARHFASHYRRQNTDERDVAFLLGRKMP